MLKKTKVIAQNQKVSVGLEDSKRTWKLSVRVDNRRVARVSMPSDREQLTNYFRAHYPGCSIQVMYEAGFSGFGLHDHLVGKGIQCFVTPPHTVLEEKDKRVKTDKVDADRLAKLLEHDDYKACHVPSLKRRNDRQVSRTLIAVQKKITSTRNQMRKFFDFHGLNEGFPSGRWGATQYRRAMNLKLDGPLGFSWECMVRTLCFLQEEKKQLRRELYRLSKEEAYRKDVAIYSSAPGVGWFTAIRLALEWGDLSRFQRRGSLGNFLGLVASEYSTGNTRRQGRITGLGSRFVRRWLVECAWVAIGRDPVLREKFENVRRHSGSSKKAIVAVARKLAERLRALYVSGTTYELGVIQ